MLVRSLVALTLLLVAAPSSQSVIKPFSLQDVQLAPGTDHRDGLELNARYLMDLETDNLLYNFRWSA
jgi:hypothetical protein